jgi:hypothetical protein
MPFDVALPLCAASGVTLLAVFTWFGWPQLRLRSYNQLHNGLRVIEIALQVSRAARPRGLARGGAAARRAELVIYVTFRV